MTTTFFSTAATVIPVLLIAGILSPATLRDYSRHRKPAILLEAQIGIALGGTVAALFGSCFGGYEEVPEWATNAAFSLSWAGIVTGTLFLFLSAHASLHQNPHPDRLNSEEKDLERRLSLIRSQKRQPGEDNTSG